VTTFEDRVRAGLAGAARDYDPPAGMRRAVDRRVRRRRRARAAWTAVGVLGTLVLVAGLGVLLATGDDGRENVGVAATSTTAPSPPVEWRDVVAFELTAEAPTTWRVQTFDEGCRRGANTGMLISNLDRDVRIDSTASRCPADWLLNPLPGHYVVVEISRTEIVGPPTMVSTTRPVAPDSELPLDAAAIVPEHAPDRNENPRERPSLRVVIDGDVVAEVSVWLGPDASDADLALARRIVESIHLSSD
jgi:hypothetical protein